MGSKRCTTISRTSIGGSSGLMAAPGSLPSPRSRLRKETASMPASYLMEHPKEAQRLADKVDADAWVATHFAHEIPPGARVLDVGCGPGVIAAAVADSIPGAEVVALDASPARIAVAAEILERYPD